MSLNVMGLEINIRKELFVVIVLCLCIAVGLAGYGISRSNQKIIVEAGEGDGEENIDDAAGQVKENDTVPAVETGEADDEIAGKTEDEIKVYIVGCVKNPGVVTLKKGQLIDDAVKAAGGVTSDADLNGINLVYKLNENVMLYIRSKKESEPIRENGEAGKAVKVVSDSGGVVIGGDEPEKNASSKININTASASELDTLPGIGEATAKDIIEYREKNGPFKSVKDIMKVPRIKESRFNSIKDFITIY